MKSKAEELAEEYAPIDPNNGHESCLEQTAFLAGYAARDNEIADLQQKLDEAIEVIKFYADHTQMNHGFTADSLYEDTCFVNISDFENINEIEPNEYREHEYEVYGMRAREYLKKVGG
jgi:hypothetical protein